MSKFCKWTRVLCACGLLPMLANAAHDHEIVGDTVFNLHGFITQGYFVSDDNNVSGDSESGSLDFREIALNSSWSPAQNWLLSAQLMSRRMGEVDDGNLRVDFAQVDYRFFDHTSGFLGARLGRVKIPYGIYNDTRDVAFTRPSIMLPQSIYQEGTRNLLLSADGLMLYGSHGFSQGIIDSELLAGYLVVDTELEQALIGFDAPGKLDDSPAAFWRVMYKSYDQTVQYGLTLAHAKVRYDSVGAGDLFPADGEIAVDQAVLSYQYNWQRWAFTSEYLFRESEVRGFGGIFDSQKPNMGDAVYGQLEYRVSPKVSLFVRRELGYANKHDRNGKQAAAESGMPAHRGYLRDWTLGAGWQPAMHWLLRAELHHLKGTMGLSPLDNPDSSELEQNWNLFILQATYRF
ncbi:hypothetical protein ACFVYJ_11460 [Pontibacter sp. JAM-7]|uniref:hypothetical protein n=1 Tax=Pontibacter sp. JAM-7 TaxID=3366581 RepID=UPI003AF465E8